ncbi:MAG: hypothetical protein JWM11_647 [Planctomycetaceae bacterium]|nr:hypothetical protein [Planctomycetaceae bacterium]
MPKQETLEKAEQDKREGKAPTTQAGEFIKETIDDMRAGKIGARSTKQAIAIGLSKARRAGVDLPPPKKGKTSEKTRKSAERAYEVGQSNPNQPVNPKRSQASTKALQREGHQAVSHAALSEQATEQAEQRTPAERKRIGRKAAQTRLEHQTGSKSKSPAQKSRATPRVG